MDEESRKIPEVDLEIVTKTIDAPSRRMGWVCSCGRVHLGKNKDAPKCDVCGVPAPNDGVPPGDPVCAGCMRADDREHLVKRPEGHGPMDGPWRNDGTHPPISEQCSRCGGPTIMGLYLQRAT